MRVWKFGDDVDTDQIIPAEFLTTADPEELAKHAFAKVRPEFPSAVRRGDVIVAGRNFGCGSSREHAPRALKGAGISCVIASSFARIFFRNAINTGLRLIEADISDKVSDGDEIEIDYRRGIIKNITKKEEYVFRPLPEFMENLIEMGGLVPYVKKRKQMKEMTVGGS
ncbi:MAG: 3-isopropylmalate dehydratase small subunit [Canidatus Methanoxibalbensis ujae]|nr:3-isopropylmalate dehydratase small subunit [Candidatus Methanoxibalbensis ujae]